MTRKAALEAALTEARAAEPMMTGNPFAWTRKRTSEPVNPTMTRDELVAAAESIGMPFSAPSPSEAAEQTEDDKLGQLVDEFVCMKSGRFNGEPPYVGNAGIMLALRHDYDELHRLRAAAKPREGSEPAEPIKSSYSEIPDNSPVSAAKPTAGSEPLREALLEARKYVHAASCEGESYVRSKQAARVLRQIDVALATAQEQRHD